MLLAATAVAAGLGAVAVAAHQVAFAIWTFLALALDAVAIAGQALVGRYLGAADVRAARAAARRMIELSVAGGVLTGVGVVLLRPAYVPLFTSDPDVRRALAEVLVVVGVLQPLAGAVFALDGILIGAGDGRYLAWAGLGTMAAFLAAAAVSSAAGAGLLGLWAAMGVFMLARLAFLGPRAAGDAWLLTGAVLPVRTRGGGQTVTVGDAGSPGSPLGRDDDDPSAPLCRRPRGGGPGLPRSRRVRRRFR